MEPKVEVLGVYRLALTEDLIDQQLSILYPDDLPEEERAAANDEIEAQLESTVLIEVLVRNRDDDFDAGDFTQSREGVSPEDWQTAWAETYLTADGQALAVPRWSDPPEDGDLRVAFFLHDWDPAQPLQTSYGEITCPSPRPMSERLARLAPYEPVD